MRLIKWALSLIIVMGAVTGVIAYDMYNHLNKPLGLINDTSLALKPGTSIKRLADILGARGLMERPRYLEWYARVTRKAGMIKAGEYMLKPGITPRGLLDTIVQGQVVQYAFTIVEGWNFRQMMAEMQSNKHLVITLAGKKDTEIVKLVGVNTDHLKLNHARKKYPDFFELEGRFFPDTYYFPKGDTDLNILKRAYKKMNQVVDETWRGRDEDLPYRDKFEALTMASIVEKETGVAHERGAIAGVFIRRLRKRMLLQTDPTIIYGLGAGFDGDIRYRDIRNPHPYNTYVHRGLPPTPIAMPGKEAIFAALHPKPGRELYFVARGDGSHYFSATLTEHNAAVNKFQRKRRNRK